MATVSDPLCGESHPIKVSQGGKEFYYCGPSHSTVWLSNPLIKERLLGNGGRIRANPLSGNRGSDEEESGASPDEVPQRQPANQLSPLFRKLGLTGETEPVRCGNCGKILATEVTPCPYCGVELEW